MRKPRKPQECLNTSGAYPVRVTISLDFTMTGTRLSRHDGTAYKDRLHRLLACNPDILLDLLRDAVGAEPANPEGLRVTFGAPRY